MSSFSVTPKKRRDGTKSKFKVMGNHNEFLSRIKKTLYYGKLPITERFSLPVSELAAELFSEVKNGQSLERLDLEEAAAMSRSACVSPCSLVLALLYLERLKTCNPEYLQRVAPSELFLVSMMVASKFLHDDGEPNEVFNDEWAESAGLDVKDINRFERDFLQAIEWEVFVSERSFWTRLCRMEKDIALKEGKRRGWFSYTDLENLLDTVDIAALAQALITVSAVCLTSYTASVLTLLGSAFIVSQIPGTTISTSVPATSPCDVPTTLLTETPMDQPQCQTSPVGVLTTSFILASLSSCPSANNSDSSCVLCGLDRGTLEHPVNRSDNTVCNNAEVGWSETLLDWMRYISWHWWRFEQLLPSYSHVSTRAKPRVFGNGNRRYKLDDAANRSGAHSRQMTEAKDNSQEWITEIRNWLDQTVLERSSQTKFFPLEMAASNY
ncbi:protein CNPPD1 [Periplaneta americana]|uniref:protein CNPPD1 n=1 Tax=Periplaneta americana TaxID=6978 RepID=UPI0037E7FE94